MKKKVKFLIIGAGPTGLGAAYKLKELNENDFLILEKTSKIGGLSTSYRDDQGFVWDIGGHVQFSHYDYFDKAMDHALGKDGWLHHQRESACRSLLLQVGHDDLAAGLFVSIVICAVELRVAVEPQRNAVQVLGRHLLESVLVRACSQHGIRF